MEGQLPFTLTAYDKDYAHKGPVPAPRKISAMVRRNAPGQVNFELDSDHARVDALTAPGARCTLDYRPHPDLPLMRLLSGTVDEVKGSGSSNATVRTFTILDDWTVLNEIIGWPNPTGTAAQQGDDEAYYTVRGPAEDVLCNIVSVNAARQGVRLTVPASSGRGAAITTSVRFHPLSDRLFPAVDLAGIGVRVVQEGTTRVLRVYTPTIYPRTLTEGSGVVQSGTYATSPPTLTRVTIGAGGQGTARLVREYVDTAREALWGIRKSAFIDARDIAIDNPNLEAILSQRATEALAAGAPKASLKVELIEAGKFRFGVSFALGDEVSIQLGGGAPVLTDIVREVDLEWSVDTGLVVTPRVGDWQDSQTDDLYKLVAKAMRSSRDAEAR